jgi:hypothetical protein
MDSQRIDQTPTDDLPGFSPSSMLPTQQVLLVLTVPLKNDQRVALNDPIRLYVQFL